MKKILLSAVMVSSGLCLAQDVGRVLSAIPVVQQVGVPRQVCSTEQIVVQQPKSGAGAVMGAIAGGAMGNAIGGGTGKAAATMIGLIGGAIVGDNLEGAGPAQSQSAQRCSTQTHYENRAVAYNVVYEFAGKQYSVQMPNDPGPTVTLQILPVGANAPASAPSEILMYQQPAYVPATPVVMAPPGYPGYYLQPFYPPISIGLGFGFGFDGGYGGGHRHRHHGR